MSHLYTYITYALGEANTHLIHTCKGFRDMPKLAKGQWVKAGKYSIIYTFQLIKRLKQEGTNSSYEEPKLQGAKRRPDVKKGGGKLPHPVYLFQHF